LGRADIV